MDLTIIRILVVVGEGLEAVGKTVKGPADPQPHMTQAFKGSSVVHDHHLPSKKKS